MAALSGDICYFSLGHAALSPKISWPSIGWVWTTQNLFFFLGKRKKKRYPRYRTPLANPTQSILRILGSKIIISESFPEDPVALAQVAVEAKRAWQVQFPWCFMNWASSIINWQNPFLKLPAHLISSVNSSSSSLFQIKSLISKVQYSIKLARTKMIQMCCTESQNSYWH